MAITPYVKKTDEEIRQMVKQNRASGEVEPGSTIELDLPSEEPEYHQWDSAEQMYASFQSISESWNKLLEPQVKVDMAADAMDREYKTYEYKAESSETDSSGQKTELLIGTVREISFRQESPKVDVVKESTTESPDELKRVAEQAPSDMSEVMSYVDFKKWSKKGFGQVFGIVKGLFGGIFNIVKEATKVEKPKTEAQLKAEKKSKEQGAEKSAFYARLDKAQSEAQASAQAIVAKTMNRLGLGGMSADMLNAYLGENRNSNSEEVNVYTAFEVARKAEEAKKAQEKQVKDMQMAQAQGPTINIDAAVEGGTGGGKANMSAVSAGG
jgi:hypothetical protein